MEDFGTSQTRNTSLNTPMGEQLPWTHTTTDVNHGDMAHLNNDGLHDTKWQNGDHLQSRRYVLFQIVMLLKSRYGMVDIKVTHIARRVELALYTRAHSVEEYLHADTLVQRLQALVVKLYAHQVISGVKPKKLEEDTAGSRKRALSLPIDHEIQQKHRRLTGFFTQSNHSNNSSFSFFKGYHQDAVQHIFSFVSTSDILKCYALSQAAQSFLPKCVSEVNFKCEKVEALPAHHVTRILLRLPNITRISLSGPIRTTSNILEFKSNVAVQRLIQAIGFAQPQKLQVLSIDHGYCDNLYDHVTESITRMLMTEACPNLVSLFLRSNCIADEGARHLSNLIRSKHCEKLSVLDIERNFVGERGCIMLSESILRHGRLADKNSICILNMRQNLVHGPGVERVGNELELLAPRSCNVIRDMQQQCIVMQTPRPKARRTQLCTCCGEEIRFDSQVIYI